MSFPAIRASFVGGLMAQAFQVNEQVKLKSGGPTMTVKGRSQIDGYLVLHWLVDGRSASGLFPSSLLCRMEETGNQDDMGPCERPGSVPPSPAS